MMRDRHTWYVHEGETLEALSTKVTKTTTMTTMHGGTSTRNIARSGLTARSTEFLLGLGRCPATAATAAAATAAAATAAAAAAATAAAAAAKLDRQSPSAPRRLARLVGFVLGIEKVGTAQGKRCGNVAGSRQSSPSFVRRRPVLPDRVSPARSARSAGIRTYTYKPSNEVQRTERTLFNFLAPSIRESSFMVPKSKSFEREQRTRWCFGCPVTHCTRKGKVHSQGS
ncbi:hypothetical protein V1478_007345 [Vespula squamosa]|uniref:Uncharacterized protein n=1 Tax=Vespula squamosa TaxID=30214 RepID=A0ABD2B2W6_VESSQ